MKTMKSVLPKAGMIFLIFTLLCGVIYTGVVTGIAQLIFPDNAGGSIIEVDGKKYGCELLGQQYTDESHMWGRIMNIDVSTYTDENGKALMYAAPSNLSPASEEYAQLVAERVEKLRNANPEMDETAVPVDLVTCSGSGLDPHISPAAAEYQVARIAKADVQEKFLLRNGANEVVYPEKQLAKWTAIRYSADHILDYIELDENHAMFEIPIPKDWADHSIGELDIRKKFNINIMGIKKSGKLELSISSDTVLKAGDTMLALGSNRNLQKCFHT